MVYECNSIAACYCQTGPWFISIHACVRLIHIDHGKVNVWRFKPSASLNRNFHLNFNRGTLPPHCLAKSHKLYDNAVTYKR